MSACHICLKDIVGEQKNSDYHNACIGALLGNLKISPHLTFDRNIFKAEMSQPFTKGMSISGVQKKLSLKVEQNKLVPTSSGGRFIIKPTIDDFPEISANEHLTMRIGELLGIDTPPCGLLKFSNGELVYIVKRFDWIADDGLKIAKEDMAQIFQLHRSDETYKYSKSYEEVGLKIKEITGNKLVQVLEFFRRVVFSFLSGNEDLHLKNISVQNSSFNSTGIFDGLTPNYDSVMTNLYLQTESDLALDLLQDKQYSTEFDKIGFLTKPDFDLLAQRIQLTSQSADLVYSEFKRKLPLAFQLISKSPMSASLKKKYKQNFEQKSKKLHLP